MSVYTTSHFLSDLCPYANVQTPSTNMYRLSSNADRQSLVSSTVFRTWLVERKVRNVALVCAVVLSKTFRNCSWRTCLLTKCFCMPLAFVWHLPGAFTAIHFGPQAHELAGLDRPRLALHLPQHRPWNTGGGRGRNCWCRTGPAAPPCLCASHRSGFRSRGSLCL